MKTRDAARAWLAAIALAVLALATGGCSLNAEYVKADRQTYQAVAPAYLDLLEATDRYSAEEKARMKRTIETWDLRIRKAEGK